MEPRGTKDRHGRRSWRRVEELPRIPLGELRPPEREAVEAALRVREHAYAPYSNYKVGAAVVSAAGRIYTGVNVENCVYVVPHAERNALAEMAKNGERRFAILACVAANGGVPCLSCRQDMREFSGRDLDAVTVIGMGADEPERVIRCSFGELVGVDCFGPEDLLPCEDGEKLDVDGLRSVAQRWAGLWRTLDEGVFDDLHAADFIDYSPAGRPSDRDGFREGIVELHAAFPDFTPTVDDVIVDEKEQKATVRWSARGTHRGAFMKIPPTRRLVHFRGIEILKIRDGQIAERWGEWDGTDILEQLSRASASKRRKRD